MITAELATRFSSQSLVTTGFSVYRNYQPDQPDKIIAIMETIALVGPETFLGDSPTIDQPGIQIVVRATQGDGDTARLQIERLYQAMISWGAFTASSVRYLRIIPIQAPFLLKRDANERVYFAFNALVQKELSSTS